MSDGAKHTDGSLPRAPLSGAAYFAVEFDPATGEVVLLDQRLLPAGLTYLRYRDATDVAAAITDMVVRGAPAIGITAAYALAAHAREQPGDADAFLTAHCRAARTLAAARPTAVNLAWAVAQMADVAVQHAGDSPVERAVALQHAAEAIHLQDVAACKAMGALGACEVPQGATILTHCNAGALATGGYGTALGVIRAAHAAGKDIHVLADETRPYLQGARLTAWELHQDGIDVEVVTDSMAGHFMQRGEVQFCVVGSDRIAANGDVANKIGTYGVAVLARHHGIPFTVAAPFSTVDLACPTGAQIPIEQRGRDEVARVGGATLVADGIGCRHPAFDVTPAGLVSRIYTERGAISPDQGQRPQQLAPQGFDPDA